MYFFLWEKLCIGSYGGPRIAGVMTTTLITIFNTWLKVLGLIVDAQIKHLYMGKKKRWSIWRGREMSGRAGQSPETWVRNRCNVTWPVDFYQRQTHERQAIQKWQRSILSHKHRVRHQDWGHRGGSAEWGRSEWELKGLEWKQFGNK